MSDFTYIYDIGTYHGRTYYLGVRATPNLDVVRSFAVVLFYEKSNGESVEVAKIDDSEHESGSVHFDRYYRSAGANQKDFDVDVSSVFEAEERLAENWRRYARLHEENHGAE
ncbi:hypothetical protein NGM10_08705 [Halorussus salilacus]|uniref:DUF7718 family protein n=1 Tax=Halorussus salilacus TaxID=2953750 RepID=UPI00209F3F86|nr:hypothetical protein [Halorussus salilacus]USZ66811.1 hypothetical protein NGM10_08705 [Halorussus salilacus]